MTDAVEIYQRGDGEWGYRIKGVNGKIMAQSEGYATVFNANRGAQDLVRRLKDIDKNVVAPVDEGTKEPEVEIRTFGALGELRAARKDAAVVDAQGMDVTVDVDKVIITVLGPKGKDAYKLVIKGDNLKLLKDRLIAAETAVPTKEAYLLSIIERASTYTATPPTIETLVEWVQNSRGVGVNPFFESADVNSDVRDTVVDLFFERRIRTDNKKGLVIVEREGR